MPAIELLYGKGRLRVAADGDLLAPRAVEPVADEARAVWEALANPIGTAPLGSIVSPGERVAIIVNDITRLTRTGLFLPAVVEALNRAGIADRDLFIVFALGNHRRQTPEEQRLIVGEAIYSRIRCLDHDAADDAGLLEVGTTSFGNRVEINRTVWEADRIVLTGEIIPHLIAGYSGGRKSLVPGVAGSRTITFNHRMIFHPGCGIGRLEGNPAHEDLLEACRLVGPDFLVNVVLRPDGRLVRVVAGHYELAHREGCRTVEQMSGVLVDRPYDLIIASAGGFPLDIDLRQAHKGLENACQALRPGGSILFYAECSGGSGSRALEDYVRRYRDDSEMREVLLREFVIGGHKAYWLARLGRLYDVHLVSSLDADFVRRCHLRPVAPGQHAAALETLLQQAGPRARVGVIPHAGFTLPMIRTAVEAARS